MFSNFRKTFKPTKEEKIKLYEDLLENHNRQIGHCSTCIHFVGSDAPGFVTDYGTCKLAKDVFPTKVCSMSDVICDDYEEITNYPMYLEQLIAKAKGE